MRIAAADSAAAPRRTVEGQDAVASFGRDRTNLGLLAADLVGAPLGRVSDLSLAPSQIADHISAAEGQLLRGMLRLETAERLDGELICHRMGEVISAITAEAVGHDAKLSLAIRLDAGSRVAESIRRASDGEIETSDMGAQLEFARADLSSEPYFARVRSADNPEGSIALFGQALTYHLAPYRQPGSSAASDWEFASCERADLGRPPGGVIIGSEPIEPGSLEIANTIEAQRSFPRKRGRVERWDDYLSATESKEAKKTDLDRKHQAFSLLLLLEMAYAAADVFPVEILPGGASDRAGDLYTLQLASRFDPARAKLSAALDLEAPAIRLTKMLESDDVHKEGGWTLTETGALGDRSQDTEWRFVPWDEESPREMLRFEGASQADVRGRGFLVPPGMGGEIVQFKRRRKALKVLREHTELLRMFCDPRHRIEDSHDPLDQKEKRFQTLDMSKQDALREILSTVPLFLLQGPPGVGKTYLVGDIVRRRFEDDPTARMLLSAQSNAAIDHLMKEVQSIFEESTAPPVMVRARPADDDPADTDLEIDRQADRHLQALASSNLVREASQGLRDKVLALAEARREEAAGRRTSRGRRLAAEGLAFEGMILRAANLVFATTNSAAIERLIEERSLFDWSIIEEAGKATGAELLSPLLLSHRRLMIGDHKQLPPYGADRMTRLLASPDKVKTAITTAQDLISRYLKDPAIEELFDEVEAEIDDFGRICSDTLSILTLFESMVEVEFARKPRATPLRPIARRLEEQHRMHPAIATIVSKCFYEGKLSTNQEKAKEYRDGVPPFRSVDSTRLPDKPIVFIDMPYVRSQRGYRGGDRSPPWSNADEVQAAVQALSLLRAEPAKHPSVAVLSPYREQVNALGQAISARMSGSLDHLLDFHPAVGDEDYCGTVDSFQGDQADLVLISMVRNNAHATPAKALGFLRDNRRMNVLLSRAKWRMIVVGSLEFYRNVVDLSSAIPEAELGFLKRFLTVLGEAETARDAAIVPWVRLSGRSA
jgi:hypothetical protein